MYPKIVGTVLWLARTYRSRRGGGVPRVFGVGNFRSVYGRRHGERVAKASRFFRLAFLVPSSLGLDGGRRACFDTTDCKREPRASANRLSGIKYRYARLELNLKKKKEEEPKRKSKKQKKKKIGKRRGDNTGPLDSSKVTNDQLLKSNGQSGIGLDR